MANAYYPAFAAGLPNAEYDLNTATIKAALVRGYAYNAAHATMDDMYAAGGVVNATATLANVTLVGGVLDAEDTTLNTSLNASSHVIVLYQASAVTGGADVAAANQKLIAYYDSGDGLPAQPGAGTLKFTWSNATAKILKVG